MKAGGSRSGSILIIALFVATILGFLAASYTRSALAELKLSNATFWEKSAINIAEAGAETAVLALNTSDWSGWSQSSTAGFDVWREFPPFDVGNGQTGTVTVGVRNFGGNNPTIITEALIQLDSGQEFQEQIEIRLRSRSLFANGVTTKYTTFFTNRSTVRIDGYDSREGEYDPYFNRSDTGTVAGSSLYATYRSRAEIYGKVASRTDDPRVGVGGKVQGANTPPWIDVDPNLVASDFQADLPDISPPGVTRVISGLPTDQRTIRLGFGSSVQRIRVSGDLFVDSDQTLRIEGKVVLVVDDDVDIRGKLEIIEPFGELELFVRDDFSVSGRGLKNRSKAPEKLAIYSTDNGTGGSSIYNLGGKEEIYAVVYAPRAFVNLRGYSSERGELFGSVVGQYVIFRDDYDLHFDENLKNLPGPTASYVIDNWRILDPSEMVTLGL